MRCYLILQGAAIQTAGALISLARGRLLSARALEVFSSRRSKIASRRWSLSLSLIRGKGSTVSKSDPIKALSRRFPLPTEIDDVIADLETKNDREIAIIGGGLLECCFERALIRSFQDHDPSLCGRLFQNRGPLSDLDSKILMARALGLINASMAEELNRVRLVRNAFAHAIIAIDFDTEVIKTELAKSELAASFFSMLSSMTHEDELLTALMQKRYSEASGKDRYIFIVRCGCSVLGY